MEDTLVAAEAEWAAANHTLLEHAFTNFLATGEWPEVDRVQRDLDRAGGTIDVREALRHRPEVPGEMRAWEPSLATVPPRLLRFVPAATELIEMCLAIVRRAVDIYFNAEVEDAEIGSGDILAEVIRQAAECGHELSAAEHEELRVRVMRAGRLAATPGLPLGGGVAGGEGWSYAVDGRLARRYRDVATVDDMFAMQSQILAEWAVRAPRVAGVTIEPAPRKVQTVFVLMPFGCAWSSRVYTMVRDAVASIAPEDWDVDVYRADDIVAPGKITEQITHAIENADVLVADITGTNPNVMWELGYAQALRQPVVILNQDVTASPFDLRDWRQVQYAAAVTAEDQQRVAVVIREALGVPPALASPARD